MDQELFQWIREAKQGNVEAFARLMSRYKGTVYRQAYGMLNDPTEAQDITQEAFVKAYYSLKKLDSEYAFVSWMTRIVFHLCHDRIQERKKEKQLREAIREERIPTGSTEVSELRVNIEEAMRKLSPELREVIVLRDIQGFSYNEIAEILQIPVGTVKSRIHAARLILRNEFTK